MNKAEFKEYIKCGNFRELFITEMGWNNYRGQADLPPVMVDELTYNFTTIAERSGFQILLCEVDAIPPASLCRRIDVKLRRSANDYIAIYMQRGTEHHQWITPVRQVEKRDIVTIEYETAEKADFLFGKIDDLSFDLDETTTIVDVKQRVHSTFAVNSEKITKDFSAGFKKEHDAFVRFITGIDDEITDLKQNRNKQWYTSVMLNRLMFCYFIQKKGFLDGNVHYLREKLQWCKEQHGEDKFFGSFYKGFLLQLFQDGLNSPTHRMEFEQVYGKIPYLNGGMFDQHQIERDYTGIDIADEAFERLFDFFDKWRWHLDTRISASGKDINPDVLGYIFEQYINDRAQMGAYYTKEDITEYIGRNCILPFLFDKVKISENKEAWKMLTESGDRYIYSAVKRGYSADWQQKIPENIAIGLDTESGNLLERRRDWNTPTSEEFALPTEIWRETIERLKRCEDILGKIRTGEVHEINDFITYNLDIRAFAQDLLEQTDSHHFVRHFYHALQSVTILDPTCGSGAFLFAAMNILEPLYEVCINRMEEFNERNHELFKEELGEITQKYRSNIQYFIYKSIILRNLYGVDIMAEAVEIAKLRLFLKMVAVVEVDRRAKNLGLDPLPDIDFNIRCGNTLVGYATEEEAVAGASADLFTAAAFQEQMEDEMAKVSMAYDAFRTIQLSQHEDMIAFKEAKSELRTRLTAFTDLLNRQLFSHSGGADYDAWLASHQPFHWIAEYYQIIHGNGGFDVIIGNPPYVEYSKVKKYYKLSNFYTEDCGNLYANVYERSCNIINENSFIGMIVQLPISCTDRMQHAQDLILKNAAWVLTFDDRPGKLFDNLEHIRATIFITSKGNQLYSTNYIRWYSETRNTLFRRIFTNEGTSIKGSIPKIGSGISMRVWEKINKKKTLSNNICRSGHPLYYHNAPQYFTRFTDFIPYFAKNEIQEISSHVKSVVFPTKEDLYVATSIMNSNIFYYYNLLCSNCRDLTNREIYNFPIGIESIDVAIFSELSMLANKLMEDYKEKSTRKSCFYTSTGKVEYDEYYPKLSKPIIDEIDKDLAKHYGFTDEELDFIINYDIKYRMGDELNAEEE